MFEKSYRKVIILCAVVAAFLLFEKWKHKFDRPWAYAGDQVLLGKWQGDFQDPRGIRKHIKLEILEPEEDRNEETYIPRAYPESREFRGFAKIKSKLGVEDDWVHGFLGAKDGHQIDRIDFMAKDEQKHIRESFNLSNTTPGAVWEGDIIRANAEFTYRTKTGSAFWDSADPIYKKTVPLTLHKVK